MIQFWIGLKNFHQNSLLNENKLMFTLHDCLISLSMTILSKIYGVTSYFFLSTRPYHSNDHNQEKERSEMSSSLHIPFIITVYAYLHV